MTPPKAIALASALVLFSLVQGCARRGTGELTLPRGKTAEIVFVAGNVFVSRGGEEWVKAQAGDVLEEGAKIRTEGDSYCEITLSSGSIFRLKDRSEVRLIELPESGRNHTSSIRLVTGSLVGKVKKLAYGSEQTLSTSTAVLAVRGTGFLVETERAPQESSLAEHGVGSGLRDGERGSPGATAVLVADGAVRVRLNVEASVLEKVPGALKTVRRLVERGLMVKGGYRLDVPARKYETVASGLRDASGGKAFDEASIEALKREATLQAAALAPEDLERLEELKSLAISFRAGERVYASPNYDGVNDEFVFDTTGLEFGAIRGWRLVVRDGRARALKTVEEGGGAAGRLPARIRWNLALENGTTLPDGQYVYELYSLERRGGATMRVRGVLEVDTRPPDISIHPQDMTFSPNGDGVKDVIAFTLQAESDARWSCVIASQGGAEVKRVEWGSEVPIVFEWDGAGESGKTLPDGLYDLTITGTDRAGNATVRTVREISLDTRSRGCAVAVDPGVFSPNGDGVLDTVAFFPSLTDSSGVDTWDLFVQDGRGETARRFRGRGAPPPRIDWDGSVERGKGFEYPAGELPSGTYVYFLRVVYLSGVSTFSYKKELVLDRDPPRIALAVSPELFSPDGDGENDTLYIVPTISDLTPITSWKVVVYTAAGSVFKIFSGTGQPAGAIPWDGISDRGIRVSSAEDFAVQADATDSAANTGKSDRAPFSIDILVVPTERGLKIQVSSIEFGFDTADLKGGKTFAILKRVVEVLRKYGSYSITIEGHTDSRGDPVYNIELSRKRAQAVGAYLVKNGIAPERLSYEGYGSKYPIDTNDTVEGRARNRRVEFLLRKK